jgi:hypothetical protein
MQILEAIIASTQINVELDISRTSYIFSPDAINEINRQLNAEQATDVLLSAPKHASSFNMKIGTVVDAVVTSDEAGIQVQCKARIAIDDDRIYNSIINDKNMFCFFPIISSQDPMKMKMIAADDEGNETRLLTPPLKVRAIYVDSKRSSFNVFLGIV